MPRSELGDNNNLVIKIKSGYNIGIKLAPKTKIKREGTIAKLFFKAPLLPKQKRDLPKVTIISTGGTIASVSVALLAIVETGQLKVPIIGWALIIVVVYFSLLGSIFSLSALKTRVWNEEDEKFLEKLKLSLYFLRGGILALIIGFIFVAVPGIGNIFKLLF